MKTTGAKPARLFKVVRRERIPLRTSATVRYRAQTEAELDRARCLNATVNGFDIGLSRRYPAETGGITRRYFRAVADDETLTLKSATPFILKGIAMRDANTKLRKDVEIDTEGIAASSATQVQYPFIPSLDFITRFRETIERSPLSIALEPFPLAGAGISGQPWPEKNARAERLTVATEQVATLRRVFYPERATHRLTPKAVERYHLIEDDEVRLAAILHARDLNEHGNLCGTYPIVPADWALDDFIDWGRALFSDENKSLKYYGATVALHSWEEPPAKWLAQLRQMEYIVFREAPEAIRKSPGVMIPGNLSVLTPLMYLIWLESAPHDAEALESVTLGQIVERWRRIERDSFGKYTDPFLVFDGDTLASEAKRSFAAAPRHTVAALVTEGGSKRGELITVLEPAHFLAMS